MGENGRWNTRDVEGEKGEKIMRTATAAEMIGAEGGLEAVEGATEVGTTTAAGEQVSIQTAAGEQECAHPEENIESRCLEFLQRQVGKI